MPIPTIDYGGVNYTIKHETWAISHIAFISHALLLTNYSGYSIKESCFKGNCISMRILNPVFGKLKFKLLLKTIESTNCKFDSQLQKHRSMLR